MTARKIKVKVLKIEAKNGCFGQIEYIDLLSAEAENRTKELMERECDEGGNFYDLISDFCAENNCSREDALSIVLVKIESYLGNHPEADNQVGLDLFERGKSLSLFATTFSK